MELELRTPDAEACRIHEETYYSPHRGGLRTRASAPPFARLHAAPTTLVLALGSEAPAAIAVVDVPELLLHGVVTRSDLELYAAKPTLLSGFVTPLAETILPLLAGEPGRVRVGLDVSAEFSQPTRAEDAIACDGLRLVAQQYDARKKVTAGRRLQQMLLHGAAPLSQAPGGSPVAQVKPDTAVEILAIRGKHAHVLISGAGYLATGWVERQHLSKMNGSAPHPGRGYGSGRGFLSTRKTRLACPQEVPLHVQFNGELVKIGILRPKAIFTQAGRPARDRVAISVEGVRWISFMKGAVLALAASDFAKCAAAQSP